MPAEQSVCACGQYPAAAADAWADLAEVAYGARNAVWSSHRTLVKVALRTAAEDGARRAMRTLAPDSYEAMKSEVRESTRNALLNELEALLTGMALQDPDTDFGYGWHQACGIVREWMVSQSETGDLNAGNETT